MQGVDSRNVLVIPYLKGASGNGFMQKASPSDQSSAKHLQESRVSAAQKPACSSAGRVKDSEGDDQRIAGVLNVSKSNPPAPMPRKEYTCMCVGMSVCLWVVVVVGVFCLHA